MYLSILDAQQAASVKESRQEAAVAPQVVAVVIVLQQLQHQVDDFHRSVAIVIPNNPERQRHSLSMARKPVSQMCDGA